MSQVDGEKNNTEIMIMFLQCLYSHAIGMGIIQSEERNERAEILLESLMQAKQQWTALKLEDMLRVTESKHKEIDADVTTSG